VGAASFNRSYTRNERSSALGIWITKYLQGAVCSVSENRIVKNFMLEHLQIGFDLATSATIVLSLYLYWRQKKWEKTERLSEGLRLHAAGLVSETLDKCGSAFDSYIAPAQTSVENVLRLRPEFQNDGVTLKPLPQSDENFKRNLNLLARSAVFSEVLVKNAESFSEGVTLFENAIQSQKYKIYPLLKTMDASNKSLEQVLKHVKEIERLGEEARKCHAVLPNKLIELTNSIKEMGLSSIEDLEDVSTSKPDEAATLMADAQVLVQERSFRGFMVNFAPRDQIDAFLAATEDWATISGTDEIIRTRNTLVGNLIDQPDRIKTAMFYYVYQAIVSTRMRCKLMLCELAAVHGFLMIDGAQATIEEFSDQLKSEEMFDIKGSLK
jgi:hypothetical protein